MRIFLCDEMVFSIYSKITRQIHSVFFFHHYYYLLSTWSNYSKTYFVIRPFRYMYFFFSMKTSQKKNPHIFIGVRRGWPGWGEVSKRDDGLDAKARSDIPSATAVKIVINDDVVLCHLWELMIAVHLTRETKLRY